VEEIPNVTDAYERFHDKGFSVLGISLDNEDTAPGLASFTRSHNMPWPQICDRGGWSAAVVLKYKVHSIPYEYLIDGDTGKIIAAGETLRGPGLAPTIQKALAAKYRK